MIILPSKTFLLRWNPQISSFSIDDYRKIAKITNGGNSVQYDWSIYEHEKADIGNMSYMMRVGDDDAGLVFRGHFISEPYLARDWAGSNSKRYYCDIEIWADACYPDPKPCVPLKELEMAMPGFNWGHGHSGIVLSKAEAAVCDTLWDELQR